MEVFGWVLGGGGDALSVGVNERYIYYISDAFFWFFGIGLS